MGEQQINKEKQQKEPRNGKKQINKEKQEKEPRNGKEQINKEKQEKEPRNGRTTKTQIETTTKTQEMAKHQQRIKQ